MSNKNVSYADFISGAWKEETAAQPSAPAPSSQNVSYADFISGAWKNPPQPQQTATPARDAQTQQRISQGLSTEGARQEKLFGKFLDRYFPQSRTSAAPRGLDPDSLAGQMMKDEANRYISNIKRYGSSTAWAEEMQKQYDSRTDKVESLSEQIRQLNLERHYGLMDTGENAERASWYDDQLTRLGLELGMAEREQNAAQKDLDAARGYAEYDAWKAQNDKDIKLLEMAHSAGLNSEQWYQGTVAREQEAADRINSLSEELRLLEIESVYGKAVYESGVYMGEDAERASWYAERIAEKKAEIERATEDLRQKEDMRSVAARTRYTDIANDPDYAQKTAQGMMKFIQMRQEDQAAKEQAQKISALSAGQELGLSSLQIQYRADASYKRPTEKWTEEERKRYFYLLGSTEQPEEADRYAERLNEAYAQAEKFAKNKAIEEWAGQNIVTGTIGTAASLGAFLVQGVDAIDKMVEYSARGTITTRPYTTATDLSNAVTAGVSGALNEWSGTTDAKILGKERGAGDLYQIAMSVAQSYAAIAAGGASGSLFFLGTGISNGIDEALNRGAKPGQAVAYGLTAGIVEVLAEKYSIDNLLGGMDVHSVVKSIAKQGGIEATEETVTTLLNSIADEIIMGDTSEYQQSMERYVMEGKTFSEASRLATRDRLNKIGESAVSGFISGGVGAGGMLMAEAFDVTPQSGTGSSGKPSPSPAVPEVQTEQKAEQATAEQNKTAPVEGAEIKDETSYINNKLRENIPGLSDMQAVAQSRAEEVRQIPGKTMAEKARVLFEKIKGIVTRPGLGEVIINARSVKDDLSHGVGTAKAAVIPAIPEVIRQGREIDFQEKWKGRNYDGYIFAAPVELDGETVYVAAVVKQTSKNKFYLHEVVDSNGNVIKINDGEEANQTSLMSPVDDAGASSPYNSPLESENSESVLSAESIAQPGEESNTPTAATEQAEPITEQAEPTTEQTNPITERPEPEARKKAEAQPEIRESALALAEKKAQKDVRSFARRITEQMDSRRVYKDVAEDLEMMVHGMLSDEVSRSEVREWAGELAEYIVDNAEVTASDMSEERQRLVQYLRNTPLSMSRAEFGDIPKGWRGKHRAVRLTEKGLPIDIAWRELGETFGYGKFPEDMYSQSDMLMQIGHYLDSWADQKVNPHEQDRDGTVQSVAEDIFDTVSERVNKASVDALKADYKAELKAMREEERARAQGRIDKLTEQRDKARAEAQELKAGMSTAVKKAVQDERTRRAEQEEKQQHVKNINRSIDSLYKKLEENSGKWHVPEDMKRAVAGMLAAIDTRSKRAGVNQQKEFADRMLELSTTIKDQTAPQADGGTQSVYLDLPAGVPAVLDYYSFKIKKLTEAENLLNMEGYAWTLRDMSLEDLAELDKTLSTINGAVNKANNLLGMNGTVNELGNELIRELAGKATRETPTNFGDEETLGNKVEKAVRWDMMTPVYFFRRLGKPGEEMFKALRQGWGEFAAKTEQIIKASEEMWTAKEVRGAERELIEVELQWRIENEVDTTEVVEDENGVLRSKELDKVRLTHAQAMDLYGLYIRPQGRGHILGAGIRVADIKRDGKRKGKRQPRNYLLSETDLVEIFQQLTDRERKLVEDMSRYMSTVGGEWGNTVTMKRWGIRGYTEETYWPIETDSRNREVRQLEKPGSESLYRLANMGFTKPLKKDASNAVVLKSAFDVFTNHMVNMAKYNTLALPLLDMMKILNYKEITASQQSKENGKPKRYTTATVQKSLDRVYGEYAQRYWLQLMQDLNGSREGGREMTDVFAGLVSNYKAASVGANLRVCFLQPTSYVRAGAVLDSGSLMYGPAHVKGAWEEALKYSGAAKWKNMGYRDSDINANVRELAKHAITWQDKAKDKGMRLAEKADQLTWGALWSASKKSVEKEAEQAGKKLSHEELIEQTVERFEDVIYRTQVMDSTLTRSSAMRKQGTRTRYMTAFMAEPTLSYNMVQDEIENIVQEGKKKGFMKAAMDNRGRMFRAIAVYAASMTASAAAASVIDAMRDDDEYETLMQKWWQAFWGTNFIDGNWYGDLSLVRKIPSIKQLTSLLDGYGGGSIEQSALTSLVQGWHSIEKLIRREEETGAAFKDNVTWWGTISAVLKSISTLSGIPLYNATRDVVAFINSTYGTWWGEKIKTYDAGASSNIKYAFKDGTITEESARKLLVEEGVCDNEDEAYWKVEAWKSADGEYSKYDKLREAMKVGDKQAFAAAMQELEEHGMYHQSVISDGVVSEIQQMYQGNNAEQIAPTINKSEAVELLEAYGEKRNGEAEKIATQWTSYLEEGIYYSGMKEAYVNEQISFDKAVSMRSKYGMMSEADARTEVLKWQCYKETGIEADNLGKAYAAGELSWEELRDAYIKYEIYEEEKAASYADKARFVGLDSYPGISYQATDAYWKYVPDMDKELYYQVWKDTKDMAGEDKDGNGRSDPYSKMDKILAYIDDLNLEPWQKDALALARDIAEKNLSRAPWNK